LYHGVEEETISAGGQPVSNKLLVLNSNMFWEDKAFILSSLFILLETPDGSENSILAKGFRT
jgi:hypothetical protein